MTETSTECPRLRPSIDVTPVEHQGERMMVLYDAAGLARSTVTLTPAAFYLLTLMNGRNTLDDIAATFARQFDHALPPGQLVSMLHQLDRSGMLESPVFEARYREMVEAYRQAPARTFQTELDHASAAKLRSELADIVREGEPVSDAQRVVGLIAPHLDYPRGRPCYASAYAQFRGQGPIDRFVILGTNHFGRSATAVWTRKDYETPLGLARTDLEFIDELMRRCGADLGERELDHLHEHSVELQVMMLQTVQDSRPCRIVPVLCPDVCGPTGFQPADGQGPGLDEFADALAEALAADAASGRTRTCVIAAADLSHVGKRFGDDCDLDEEFLKRVEQADRATLARIEAGDADGLVSGLQAAQNVYRICSAGCLYVLLRVLRGAKVRMLRYHQAVNQEQHTGVTCAAAVLIE
jgi:AmmeMemoRadiSam system protein B